MMEHMAGCECIRCTDVAPEVKGTWYRNGTLYKAIGVIKTNGTWDVVREVTHSSNPKWLGKRDRMSISLWNKMLFTHPSDLTLGK